MRERVLINLMVYNDMGELLGIVQTMIAKVKGIERRLTPEHSSKNKTPKCCEMKHNGNTWSYAL